MTTRKSGLLGLVLAVGILSACEDKTVIEPPPIDTIPEITVTVQPNPVNLVLGGTPSSQQMTATVSGAANTVTWSISGTAATINATGLVTAAAVGQAVVTAASTVNPNIRGSATVNVAAGPPPAQPPTIVITAVTQGGTLFPVVTSNVMGQIDVVAVLDVPTGVAITDVKFDLLPGGVAANAIPLANCTQTFTGTGSVDLSTNAAEPVQIICSINTAEVAVDTLGVPRFLNGTYSVRATITRPGNQTAISTTSQLLTFNNPDFVRIFSNRTGQRANSTLASMFSRGCAVAGGTPGPGNVALGRQWCGGDLQMRFVPTIFSTTANTRPNTYTVSLTTSGVGSNGTAACSTLSAAVPPTTGTPTCPSSVIVKSSSAGPTVGGQVVDTLTFFSTSSTTATTATNDISAVEDVITNIMVTSANTVSGLGGPACVNPTSGTNPLIIGGGGTGAAAPFCGTGAVPAGAPAPTAVTAPSAANFWFLTDQMRVDNLAPRVWLFDITPATLGCTQAACFINGNFTFTERAGFFSTVDYGVDSQTATFDVGPQTGFPTGATIGATSGASHAETQTPTLVIRGNTTDALLNTRAVFAGPVAATPVTTAAAAQLFGIDRTNPVILSVSAPGLLCTTVANAAPCNSTDNDEVANTITVFFADTAAGAQGGPSGFLATPLVVTTSTRTNSAGGTASTTTNIASTVTCPSATGGANACDVALTEATSAATSGYFRLVFNVRDAANPGSGAANTSASREFVHLDDEATPAVAGITAPSTISGAAAVTFTADATDNVELGDVIASNSYTISATDYYAHFGRQTIGTYGISPLDFARTAATGNALSVTMNPFIYSLEATSAAGVPSGAPGVANAINFAVRDVAGVELNVACPAPAAGDGAVGEVASPANRSNCIQRQNNNIAPNILAGTPAPASFATIAVGMTSFVQNNPVHTGATVTLQAEARGPQGTFANPFPNGVNFYRFDTALQRWIFVATATGSAIDDDIQNVRRWVYTTTVSDTVVPAGTSVRAIGINAGRGLISNTDQTVP
ncbi:MAG: Ig-like domain-containing protein [Gemmatimonadota bacterium]